MEPTALLDRCWGELVAAQTEPGHPWRLGVLATAGPAARVLVVRGVDPTAGLLWAYTDIRSEKVEQLREVAWGEWVFWHPEQRIQLRVAGPITVHTDDALASAAWAALHPWARREYATLAPPGTEAGTEVARVDEAAARAHFGILRCAAQRLEWLQLHVGATHDRVRCIRTDEGWAITRLVP